jgi:hypothetical protein
VIQLQEARAEWKRRNPDCRSAIQFSKVFVTSPASKRTRFLAGRFTLDELSEGAFGFSVSAIVAVLAAFLHFGKNPDSSTASRVLTDFELAGQAVMIAD